MEKELVHFFLEYLLKNCFESKADMARQLDVNARTLQRALEVLENDKAKGGSIILDKALMFCAQRQFSLDELFQDYYQAQAPQGKMQIDRIRQEEKERPAYTQLTLPKPERLTEDGEKAYQYALAFIRKASLYLCPRCNQWCNPWNAGNRITGGSCMLAHMANTLLADIQSMTIQG